MSDSVVPRPLTRSASKQNYSAQPVTAIAAVRDKFEKHRGHIKSTSDVVHTSGMDTETHELSCRNGKNNSSAKQTVLKESQDVANGRMSRDSYYKTKKEETKATKETVESLK